MSSFPPKNQTSRHHVQLILLPLLMIGVLLVVGFFGVKMYNESVQISFSQEDNERQERKLRLLAIDESDHIFGDSDAPVTIVMYSDAHCQFCRWAYPKLNYLVESEFVGEASLVYRHIPIYRTRDDISHEEVVGECVSTKLGHKPFFIYLSTLYSSLHSGERYEEIPIEIIVESAAAAGMDADTVSDCTDDEHGRSVIEKHHTSGGALGVVTVPHTFIVSGEQIYELVGNKPIDAYRTIIQTALGEE